MHLTRETLDIFASRQTAIHRAAPVRLRWLVRLEEGDSMDADTAWNPRQIEGPTIVELVVVYRDGGWRAREQVCETPESIALAASLAQRFPNSNTYEE